MSSECVCCFYMTIVCLLLLLLLHYIAVLKSSQWCCCCQRIRSSNFPPRNEEHAKYEERAHDTHKDRQTDIYTQRVVTCVCVLEPASCFSFSLACLRSQANSWDSICRCHCHCWRRAHSQLLRRFHSSAQSRAEQIGNLKRAMPASHLNSTPNWLLSLHCTHSVSQPTHCAL